MSMSDATKLIKRAEGLVARLEQLLPAEAPPPDWGASIAFRWRRKNGKGRIEPVRHVHRIALRDLQGIDSQKTLVEDRKSTRLNSSHSQISYAVFCLKKKKKTTSH